MKEILRKYDGNMKENEGTMREIWREHEGNIKEMWRKYEGNMKEIQRQF